MKKSCVLLSVALLIGSQALVGQEVAPSVPTYRTGRFSVVKTPITTMTVDQLRTIEKNLGRNIYKEELKRLIDLHKYAPSIAQKKNAASQKKIASLLAEFKSVQDQLTKKGAQIGQLAVPLAGSLSITAIGKSPADLISVSKQEGTTHTPAGTIEYSYSGIGVWEDKLADEYKLPAQREMGRRMPKLPTGQQMWENIKAAPGAIGATIAN